MRVISDDTRCEVKRGFYEATLRSAALPWDGTYVSFDQSEITSPGGIEKIRQNIEGTVDLLNRQQAVYRDAAWLADAKRIRFNSESGAVEIDDETGLVNLTVEQAWFNAKEGINHLDYTAPSADQPRS